MKLNNNSDQVENSEMMNNDEYFEDIISLKSDESIIEVCKKKPRRERDSITNESIDEEDFDDFSFSQDNVNPSKQVLMNVRKYKKNKPF